MHRAGRVKIIIYFQILLSAALVKSGSNSKRLVHKINPSELFLGKGVLKIRSKLTGEHSCRNAISINCCHRFSKKSFS